MSGAFIKLHNFILKLEPTSFAQVSWRETGREQEQPHLIIFPFVHTPDAAKQRAFREMGQSVKPLDPWPLASIELEGKAKERRSSDWQWWFVDEVAIFNKIGAETKENFVKNEITMVTGVTKPFMI